MLDAAGRAPALAEERYLDGYPALFPDAIAAWDAHVQSTKQSAAIAVALAEIDVEMPDHEEDWLDAPVDVLPADLVEPAKATALEKLGEGERGLSIGLPSGYG